MTEQRKNNFIIQGSILAIAGIVSRIIGMLFRIPMLAIIGEDGMGVYSTAYSIYNILLMVSSYSLPQAVSKLISTKNAQNKFRNVRQIFWLSLLFGAVLGFVASVVMTGAAEFFATKIMKMPEAVYAIRALAPTVFIMGVLGVMRGFFQGHGTMVPTAVSQILEQVLHVAISLLAGYALFQKGVAQDAGNGNYFASAYGAQGATYGVFAGAAAALLFLIFVYMLFRKTLVARCRKNKDEKLDAPSETLKAILLTAFPVLLSAALSNLGTLLDQTVYAQYVGADYRAIWGVYSSKYTVLINVPIAIATAMSSSTMPTISGLIARGEHKEARERANAAFHFILLIAVPASVGLGVLGKPCFDLLFRSTDNTLAGRMMMCGSAAVLTYCFSTLSVGVLQGNNNFWVPIWNTLKALILHLPLLAFSLWILEWDIIGVVVNHVLLSLIICVLNLMALREKLKYRMDFKRSIPRVLLCSVFMGAVSYFLYRFLHQHMGNTLSLLLTIPAAIVVYFISILLTGAVTRAELEDMPQGRKIIRAAEKLHLLHK
ncbi:MAG: polysaccharide biosynthesis protein [Lachnospiraceae bacterium]|nr:polysaccharide biosynthesis protein [Lachnospiraceae bacterium]